MRPSSKPLIALLVQRAVLFLLILCAFSLFLYAAGTAQDFLESSQLFLLRLAYLSALLLGISALYGLALSLFFARRRRKLVILGGVLVYAALVLLAALVIFLTGGILVAVVGNSL